MTTVASISPTMPSSPPLPLAGFCVETTTGNHATMAAPPRLQAHDTLFRCYYPFAFIRWTSDRVKDNSSSSTRSSDDMETTWIVVRLSTSSSDLDETNDTVTVRFRPSITLHVSPSSTDADAAISKLALESCLIREVYPLTASTQINDSIPVYSARLRLNATIESPLSANVLSSTHSPCWLAPLERIPLPAVAVVLTYPNDNDDLSPLWQACLKRQLVGCPVLWRTNNSHGGQNNIGSAPTLTTRLHVMFEGQSWTLSVESFTTASTVTLPSTPRTSYQRLLQGDSVVVGMIVPSTRITLLPCSRTKSTDTDDPQRSSHVPSPNSTTLSPTAQVLVDTIHCIRHVRNRNARIATTQPKESFQCDIPRAFLLSGPPGVGKTHAVRMAVASVQECHLVVVQGSELVGMSGEAGLELERIWVNAVAQTKRASQRDSRSGQCVNKSSVDVIRDSSVAVIFLDECDALFASNTEQLDTTSLMVATMSRLLDRLNTDPLWKHVLVIAATNRVETLPVSLRRPGRFDREIAIAPPNAAERLTLLRALLSPLNQDATMPLDFTTNTSTTNEDQLAEIAEATVGYVAADLSALVRRAWLLRCLDPTANIEVVDFLEQAMSDVGASALRDAALQRPKVPASSATLSSDSSPWDSIAGDPGGAKTALRQAIEWPRTKHRAYQKLGLAPPRGILLHGPPGCAKTTLARAAAVASSGVAFLSLSPADVYSSSYVGEAEGVVRRAFALARSAAPCVLFFDEIDSILGSEDNSKCSGLGRSTSTNAESRVLSTFLNEMDGVDGSLKDGVLVLGATNRPGTLDAALLRPGRFDKIIYVPPPDFEGRRSILSSQCKQWPCSVNVDVDRFAHHSISGAMTGAEIVGACREAALRWFRDVPSWPSSASAKLPLSDLNGNHLGVYLEAALLKVKPLLSDPVTLAEYTQFDERCG